MFCKKCGAELHPEMKFCSNCGVSCEEQIVAAPVESTVVPTTTEVAEAPVESTVVPTTTEVAEAPVENTVIPATPEVVGTPVENTVAPTTPEVVGTPVENTVVGQVNPVPNPVNVTNMNPQPVNPISNGVAYPQAPMQPQNKKKDYIFIIAIVVIGLALIAIPILLSMNKDNKESSNSNKNSNSSYSSNTNNKPSNNNSNNYYSNTNSNNHSYSNTNFNSNSNSNSVNGSTVTYGNYTFTLPRNVKATVDSDGMSVENLRTSSEMGVFMIQDDTSYEELKVQKELLKLLLQASGSGSTIGDITVKTYQGMEFLAIPVTQEGMQFVCGITKLSETEVMMVMLINERGTLDYTLLNEAASIIKTAKRNGASGM